MDIALPECIERPPDYKTCGPTSLRAIYRYCTDPSDLGRQRLRQPHADPPEGLEAA